MRSTPRDSYTLYTDEGANKELVDPVTRSEYADNRFGAEGAAKGKRGAKQPCCCGRLSHRGCAVALVLSLLVVAAGA